jgi:hypothetical protein
MMSTAEARRAANQRFYQRHKEEEKARTSKWRKDNKEWWDNYYKENKEKIAANSRKSAYGITQQEFENKIQKQDGKCAICGKALIRPDVDHDHACCSGKRTCGKCIRGILCHGCNTIIGLAGDSIKVLSSAIQYLKGYQK